MGKQNFLTTLWIAIVIVTLTLSEWQALAKEPSELCFYKCQKLVNCSVPTSPADGSVTYSGLGFEATANYTCNSGYNLVGLSSRTCQSDSMWSGVKPTCEYAGCGLLSPPTHGDVNYDGYLEGNTATITCDKGYVLSGTGLTTCRLTGWEVIDGDCVRVSCATPEPPVDGSVSAPDPPVFEDEAVYSCNSMFVLNGQERRCCLSTGLWSGTAPTCVPLGQLDKPLAEKHKCLQCPIPVDPNYGELTYTNGITPGKVAKYRCYCALASGHDDTTCQTNGTWSGEPTCLADLPTNLALNKVASQPSQWQYGSADKAVDGCKNNDWRERCCSHTDLTYEPWWHVDLGYITNVFRIVITRRWDDPDPEVRSRMNGFKVYVTPTRSIKTPVYTETTDQPGPNITIELQPWVTGRYVTIKIPGRETYLTLCEVEVYGVSVNLALNKDAKQSSLWEYGTADKAVDGCNNNNWFNGCCSHTNLSYEPWWQVDLGYITAVVHIVITRRWDDTLPEVRRRMNGFQVFVTKTSSWDNELPVYTETTDQPGPVIAIELRPWVAGRFVTIVIPGREDYLTLCEVAVFGDNACNLVMK